MILLFFALKINPLHLESHNQASNFSLALSSSPYQGQSVKGFMSYDRTNKQTNRDYNFIYILGREPSAAQVTEIYFRRLPTTILPGSKIWVVGIKHIK